jgi:hypothetical protein
MKDLLIKEMEVASDNFVKDAIKNNPMAGTPFEGMVIYTAISTLTKNFTENLKKDKALFGLTDQEIDTIVEEMMVKISNKYLHLPGAPQ